MWTTTVGERTLRRRGFSRRELIVLVVIAAIGLAFLPTAVVWLRERNHRLNCENNLRRIHAAFAAHHLVRQHLPDGGGPPDAHRSWTAKGTPATAPEQDWGWAYQILPMLSAEGHGFDSPRQWENLEKGEGDVEAAQSLPADYRELWANTNEEEVRSSAIRLYFCRSRRAPGASVGGKVDYAGNGGTDFRVGGNGLLFYRGNQPPLRADRIPDGSAVVLVAEKWFNAAAGAGSEGDARSYVSGFGPDTIRWGAQRPMPDNGAGSPDRFGSAHPASFNALLADGSVRRIAYDIEPRVFRELCRRNDTTAYGWADEFVISIIIGRGEPP